MPYIRIIPQDEAAGRIKSIYDAARNRAGDVANIVKLMSLDARVAEGSMHFYTSLMKSPNALDAARHARLAAVVSNANECFY